MGGVASPFDPSGETEGQTLTNTCQTKLLGTTKDNFMVPLDVSHGVKPWGELDTLSEKWNTAGIIMSESEILWCDKNVW